jgi:hypothetical protein
MIFASNRFREKSRSSRGAGVSRQPQLHCNLCRFGAIANSDPNANSNSVAIPNGDADAESSAAK